MGFYQLRLSHLPWQDFVQKMMKYSLVGAGLPCFFDPLPNDIMYRNDKYLNQFDGWDSELQLERDRLEREYVRLVKRCSREQQDDTLLALGKMYYREMIFNNEKRNQVFLARQKYYRARNFKSEQEKKLAGISSALQTMGVQLEESNVAIGCIHRKLARKLTADAIAFCLLTNTSKQASQCLVPLGHVQSTLDSVEWPTVDKESPLANQILRLRKQKSKLAGRTEQLICKVQTLRRHADAVVLACKQLKMVCAGDAIVLKKKVIVDDVM